MSLELALSVCMSICAYLQALVFVNTMVARPSSSFSNVSILLDYMAFLRRLAIICRLVTPFLFFF